MNPYEILQNTLNIIEDNLENQITIEDVANINNISAIHLQRIFKHAFGVPIAGYIRSRRMAAGLEKLVFTDLRVIDIANELGFEHEQSFIRTFKQEYNITPGQLRKKKSIIKTTPMLDLSNTINISNGVLFQPEIVIVPEIYLVGKLEYISQEESLVKAPKSAINFWENDRHKIKNAVNYDIYYGYTRFDKMIDKSVYYLSAVQTKNLTKIPIGFYGDTFPSSRCVKFSYIGNHHYYEINHEAAKAMYEAISDFFAGNTKYMRNKEKIFFERIDGSANDEAYCCMEWFTPIILL